MDSMGCLGWEKALVGRQFYSFCWPGETRETNAGGWMDGEKLFVQASLLVSILPTKKQQTV